MYTNALFRNNIFEKKSEIYFFKNDWAQSVYSKHVLYRKTGNNQYITSKPLFLLFNFNVMMFEPQSTLNPDCNLK